jgi:hypothetical protein
MSTPKGATSLGRYLYLFKSKTNSTDCIISAHGGYMFENRDFTVPSGITLQFFSVHSSTLTDPGINAFQKNQAQAIPVETIQGGAKCRNYLLSKYQGKHNKMDETYESIASGVTQQDTLRTMFGTKLFKDASTTGGSPDKVEQMLKNIARNHGGSVLTVRNRFDVVFGIPLQDALKAAKKEMPTLRVFYCLFCRSNMVGDDKHQSGVVQYA